MTSALRGNAVIHALRGRAGAGTPERPGRHSHADHGNEMNSLRRFGLRQRPGGVQRVVSENYFGMWRHQVASGSTCVHISVSIGIHPWLNLPFTEPRSLPWKPPVPRKSPREEPRGAPRRCLTMSIPGVRRKSPAPCNSSSRMADRFLRPGNRARRRADHHQRPRHKWSRAPRDRVAR